MLSIEICSDLCTGLGGVDEWVHLLHCTTPYGRGGGCDSRGMVDG